MAMRFPIRPMPRVLCASINFVWRDVDADVQRPDPRFPFYPLVQPLNARLWHFLCTRACARILDCSLRILWRERVVFALFPSDFRDI